MAAGVQRWPVFDALAEDVFQSRALRHRLLTSATADAMVLVECFHYMAPACALAPTLHSELHYSASLAAICFCRSALSSNIDE